MRKLIIFIVMLAGACVWAGATDDASYDSFYRVKGEKQHGHYYYGYNLTTKTDTFLSVLQLKTTGYDAFGYFTFDKTGITGMNELAFNSGNTADIGNVASGTNVGFWMKSDGVTYYSLDSMNTTPIINTYDKNSTIFTTAEISSGTWSDGIEFKVKAEKAHPVGQPLPGVLLSTAIGLAGLAGWKLRRK
ncbi:MAG: hypothetical protein PHQ27_07080 [Victivallales bacterium]|nr:hypothetical protein [Victivallales bacterium]